MLIKRSGFLAGLTLALVWAGSFATAQANTCAPATSGGAAASDWRSFCWLDFTGYNDATAQSAGGQAFTFTLSDGATLKLTVNATATSATALKATTAPSWTGAAIGNSSFIGIPGSPILYTTTNGATVTLTFSAISVTAPSGLAANSSYAIVAADAESTNQGESLAFTTNGTNWLQVSQVPPITGNTYPTLTVAGTVATEKGVAGTVGGYVFSSSNPTTVVTKLVAGGLQGAMFAVRYAWVSVNKNLVSTRILPADQFNYSVTATANGTPLAAGVTSGAGNGLFTPALITVASGYPVTVSESMVSGGSALSSYVSSLTCTNANAGSVTVMPTNVAVTSANLGTLAFGDAISCVFTNTALPRLTLTKALTGNRVFSLDQFTLNISSASAVVATTTTTGSGSAVATNVTPTAVVAAAAPYSFNEVAAGSTVLAYYTAGLACSNAFAGSPTTLPAALGASVTPRAGDDIRCTLANTPNSSTVALNVAKTTTAFSDPVNGTINPKRIPGGRSLYTISVTNAGTHAVDANTLVITDVIPTNTSMVLVPASGTPVAFTDGTPSSALTFAYPASVKYSNNPLGAGPYTYVPSANASGVDPAVTGIQVTLTGSMAGATIAGQPNFKLQFQIAVQ